MATILLIENGFRPSNRLARHLSSYGHVVRLPYRKFKPGRLDDVDLIVLSGGRPSVIHHYWFFRRQLELIRETQVPLLGICLGFELIAKAYGAPLTRLRRKLHGLRIIQAGSMPLHVWESHRWVVPVAPTGFRVEATSSTGVELISHTKKPIIGCQFHPEVAQPANDGPQLLDDMMRRLLGTQRQKR